MKFSMEKSFGARPGQTPRCALERAVSTRRGTTLGSSSTRSFSNSSSYSVWIAVYSSLFSSCRVAGGVSDQVRTASVRAFEMGR